MAVKGGQQEDAYKELESVLEAVDDKEVTYHLRNALQLMQCEDTE
jgi:hypothetical protein